MEDCIPRRAIITLNVDAELKIREAMKAVDNLECDVKITQAICHLDLALGLVSDFIDNQLKKHTK